MANASPNPDADPPRADADTPTPVDGSEVMLLVYDELRELARHRMAREDRGHTLQATALVHEAYLRLSSGAGGTRFQSRAHFFHAAARAMQRILVEHARSRGRAKRGGGATRVPLNVLDLAEIPDSEEILALDDAIRRLEELTSQSAAVVRLRFYAGLSVEETAEALGVSVRTVHREWRYARAWLYRTLYSEDRRS